MDVANQAEESQNNQQWRAKCQWPLDQTKSISNTYPEVEQHLAFNLNIATMYKDGERFCHPTRDSNYVGTHMSRLFFLFLHLVDECVTHVSVPSMSEFGEVVNHGTAGANAGGAAMRLVELDDDGNPILDSGDDRRRGIGNLSEYGLGIIRTFNNTIASLNAFFDACDCGQQMGMDSSKNDTSAQKKKDKIENKKRTRASTTPFMRAPVNAGMSEKTRMLPAVEVLFEKVMKCESVTREKCLADLEKEYTKNSTYIRDEEQEENAGIMEMSLNKRRRRENTVYDECASWHGYEFDYEEENQDALLDERFEESLSDLSRRAATLWSADASTLMNDPKFCAFSEICELLDGRSVTDITIHVILRVKVDVHGFLQRTFAQNNYTARLSYRNTSTLTKMQNRYLMRGGVETVRGAMALGEDEPEAQKKEMHAPRPNTMQMKPNQFRKFNEWEKFRDITSPVDYAAMVGCYSGINLTSHDMERYACDRLFNYPPDDPCNVMNAFSLMNALRARDPLCHPLQSLKAWLLKPDLYINWNSEPGQKIVLNFPLPQNLMYINPEEITPANVVFKYLPHIQEAERGFFRKMHPTFENDNQASKLLSHYHPQTYPYDPETVVPVTIGERMLTIQETEQAKLWLDQNGWDWRKRPSEARQSHSIRLSASSEAAESTVPNERSSSMSLNTNALMNALGIDDNKKIISIIRTCPLQKLYESVRRHMSSYIRLQHQLACEIRQQRKMIHASPPNGDELRVIVEASMRRHGRGIAERALRFFGGMFRPDDHPELCNNPERDGYLLNELRTRHLQLKGAVMKSLGRLSMSPQNMARTTRAIMYMIQRSGCDTYDKLACGQYSNISDFNLVLVEYEARKKMRDPENRVMYDKFDIRQSNLTNFLAHLNYQYSTFWHCLKPSLLLVMLLVSLDVNRHNFGTRFNVTVVADGAEGKSHLLNILIKHLRISLREDNEDVSIRSTSEEISAQTNCATKIHTKGRRNGGLSVWHELPRDMMVSEDENGGANPVWKDLSDKGFTITHEAHLDENGNLTLRVRIYQHQGSTIALINWDMSRVEPSAIQRCMWFLLPKSKNVGDTVQAKQAGEEQSKGTYDDVIRERSCWQHHFLQILYYHTFSLQMQGLLHISTTLAMYVILTICDDLARNSNVIMNPRATTYLMLGSTILMLMDVFSSEFMTAGGRFFDKPFNTQNLTALEPFMYVNTRHIVAAIGMFGPLCMTMGHRETRLALKEIFEQEIILRQSVTAMFRQIVINASDINESHSDNQQQSGSLFNNTMDRRAKHDFNYVRIPMTSLESFCDRIVATMQDLKTISNTFASRTISYILYSLSKSFIYSHFYIANPASPASRPVIDHNQPRKNILVVNIQQRSIEISYEFLISNDQDPETCIMKSLRKLFNAHHQPPTEYAWKTRDVCSNVIDTIWLGEGLGSKNLDNNKPSKTDPETHELVLPHVGNIIPELYEHIYKTPEERKANEHKTSSAIKIDVSLDMWAALSHHQKIKFCGKVSQRALMREMWKFGDRLAKVDDIETTLKNKVGSSSNAAIPENIMRFAQSAMEMETDDDIPDIVKKVLETYDDSNDIDVPENQFMVPMFDDDKSYKSRFLSSRRALRVVKRVPHWEALGMTRDQYKMVMSLPQYREDRIDRHHAANGRGHLKYPQVVMPRKPRPAAAEKQEENTDTNAISKNLAQHYGLVEQDLHDIFSGAALAREKSAAPPKHVGKQGMRSVCANDPPHRITPASASQAFDLSSVFGEDSTDGSLFK